MTFGKKKYVSLNTIENFAIIKKEIRDSKSMGRKGFIGEANLIPGIEYLDVVTKHDKVRGIVSYDDVHTLGYLHRVVHILVFEDDTYQRVLLPLRSRRKRLGGLCFHSSIAGHVRHGEDYWQAGYREAGEEIFYKKNIPNDFKLSNGIIKMNNNSDRGRNNEIAGILTAVCSGPFSFNPQEVVERATGGENIHKIKEDLDDRVQRNLYTRDYRRVFLAWYEQRN